MDGQSEIAPDRATNTITLEELQQQVGATPRHSRWYVLDQSRIDAFAEVTEDWQWIHTEPERAAAETPFGGAIAHGFLTLSMLSAMTYDATPTVEGAAMGVNYGFNRIRFTNPVRAGQRVRAKFVTRDVAERSPGNWITTTGVTIEIDGESRPALTAEWLGLTVMESQS